MPVLPEMGVRGTVAGVALGRRDWRKFECGNRNSQGDGN